MRNTSLRRATAAIGAPTEAEKARRILATALHPCLQAFYRDWPMPAPEAGFRSFNARY